MKAARLGLALGIVVALAVALLFVTRPRRGAEGGGTDQPLVKAHFMRKFVAALAGTPGNLMPQPAYAPLLGEGAAPLRCDDCHAGKEYEARFATDIGDEAAQPYRMRRDLMIPLMEKWVARLNQRHAGRLRKEVVCTDCHAADPRDGKARRATIAPLMIRFVEALGQRPRNEDPAKGWRPLLRNPAPVPCALCHGSAMESSAPDRAGPKPDRTSMIRLMERWVRELNRRAKDRLVKAVACVDCHEIDPRK